jgi:hypothetical protein
MDGFSSTMPPLGGVKAISGLLSLTTEDFRELVEIFLKPAALVADESDPDAPIVLPREWALFLAAWEACRLVANGRQRPSFVAAALSDAAIERLVAEVGVERV